MDGVFLFSFIFIIMKIVLNESQFDVLARRIGKFSKIKFHLDVQLERRPACDYNSFENYLEWITYKTEDNLINSLRKSGSINWENNQGLELFRILRVEIKEYILENYTNHIFKYYTKYREHYCPEE